MQIVYESGDWRTAGTFVCASMNIEDTGPDGDIEAVGHSHGLVIDGKNNVETIVRSGGDPGHTMFSITLKNGHTVKVKVRNPDKLAAGSAINVSFILQTLGHPGICVAGPIGTGRDGQTLYSTVTERGLRCFFWRGNGTSLTVSVRHEGKSTLFCEKPPYDTTEGLLAALRQVTPRIIIATGVKPMDLGVVEELFRKNGDTVRVLAPHQSLLESKELRDRLEALARRAHLLQINHLEAALLLASDRFVKNMMREVASLGAELTIVTMGKRGAYALRRGSRQIVYQPAINVPHAVDTCGAGDAHLAAIVRCLWGLDMRLSLRVCLLAAAWVASKKVQHIGPWSGIPTSEHLGRKIAKWTMPKHKRKKKK